jgi:hypothetical protein
LPFDALSDLVLDAEELSELEDLLEESELVEEPSDLLLESLDEALAASLAGLLLDDFDVERLSVL